LYKQSRWVTHGLFVTALGGFNINLDDTINNLGTVDLGVELELEALLLQNLVEVLAVKMNMGK
jgi:hypothetical protein